MRGVFTAVVTPFDPSGKIDLAAFRKILADQIDAGVAGVIPCGTTGETPALSAEEKKLLIRTAIETVRGTGVKALAGTGTNNTAETIEFSRWAAGEGVDGILVVTPYYNKPSQAGLIAHFNAVADAVSCEVMVYNVPGRTGVSLMAASAAALAAHPRMRSLKEATGNVAFTSEILDALQLAGRSMDVLAGDDATYLPLLSVGAAGVVSVASNLFPRAMVAIQKFADQGNFRDALALHKKFYPLFRDLFVESNPVPVKYAMTHAGLCGDTVRAPLAPLSSASVETLRKSLERCGVAPGSRL
ncbi:MAG: 4-hydroxy-tetrahydrodipicolinate synthase [Oligoflexia bacterium]|nr:4-hydroxy-tetrahydrodipicolinate synthase [Oligoflexia bacterium]